MAQASSGGRASLLVSEEEAGRLVVSLGGELDLDTVAALQPQIDAVFESEATGVAVDMATLEFMDSSGLAVLLRLANRFGSIELRHASPLVRRSIEVLGLADRLQIGPS